jgi:hypothetical protein
MTAVATRPARTFDAMLARLDRDIAEASRRRDLRGPENEKRGNGINSLGERTWFQSPRDDIADRSDPAIDKHLQLVREHAKKRRSDGGADGIRRESEALPPLPFPG